MTTSTIAASDGKIITYDAYFVDTDENVIFTLGGKYVGIQDQTQGKIFAITDTTTSEPLATGAIVLLAACGAVLLYKVVL